MSQVIDWWCIVGVGVIIGRVVGLDSHGYNKLATIHTNHGMAQPNTGALAQQMEEQLMQEFEALLASRRVQGQGAGKAAAAGSSSSGHQGGRRVCGKGVVRLVGWFLD